MAPRSAGRMVSRMGTGRDCWWLAAEAGPAWCCRQTPTCALTSDHLPTSRVSGKIR